MSRAIVLLSDFGTDDPWVGEMKGALLSAWAGWPAEVPRPVIIDGGHGVPRGDAAAGAWFLQRLFRSYPEGTVFVAVVDPGVGSAREALVCRAEGRWVLAPAGPLVAWLADAPDLEVGVLDRAEYRHRPDGGKASATFHGRDVFAPAAAHLAMGAPLEQVATPAGQGHLGAVPEAPSHWTIRWIDRFGNAITDLPRASASGRRLEQGGAVKVAGAVVQGPAETYAAAPAGVPFWYWGSGGTLEIGVRDGSAAARLKLTAGLDLVLATP
ncbi:MAG TPA: SAM-dependent chlorinase/fluorinase [Candidatus Krumholzibacteria bacterium]|nr:SAM-dependent chlorinase/fluorinase [Candidatus Krumholzibacteria bacterium]